MEPSKRNARLADLEVLKATREKKAEEKKQRNERMKKFEVHRDRDIMPPPAAGMKRKCEGEGKTPSSKMQKTETREEVLKVKPVLRKAGGSSFFNYLHKKGDKPMPSQAMVETVYTAWPRPTSSRKESTKGSSGECKRRSQANPISSTPAPGPDKAVSNENKRKAEEVEQLANKRRKVTEAPLEATPTTKKDSKVPDLVTDPENSKTGGSKAIGPELPGISAPDAHTIAGPINGHVTDQESDKASKSTASAEELSGTTITTSTKDHVIDPESSMSKAAGPKLTSTGKGDRLDPGKSKAAGLELSNTPAKDHATDPRTGKSSASKAAGPELPGTIKGDITDTDKSKAAGPELCGTSKKRSAVQAELEEKSEVKKARRAPVGLLNFRRACFANAVTRCLQGTAPINSYYRRQTKGVLPSVTNCGVTEGDLRIMTGSNTRTIEAKKGLVRRALRQSAEKVSLSAYFGELCERMSTATDPSVSPFVFQQAVGTRCKNDLGEPMDGERSEESFEFITHLVPKLDEEELNNREIWTEKPTVMDEVFGVKTKSNSICTACGHRDSNDVKAWWLHAAIPDQKEPLSLEECFSSFENRTRLPDYKCEHCLELGSTDTLTSIATQEYLILNANRTDYNIGKIQTKVTIPKGTIRLRAPFSPDAEFEVYGVVQHHGSSHKDGHYTALLKVDGQWWNLNDQRVSKVTDTDFDKPRLQRGCQFFLRKVSS